MGKTKNLLETQFAVMFCGMRVTEELAMGVRVRPHDIAAHILAHPPPKTAAVVAEEADLSFPNHLLVQHAHQIAIGDAILPRKLT